MSQFMLGRKAGMTQIFDEDGVVIPVTVLECGPLFVVQKKSKETDGYEAVKVAFEDKKRVNRPKQGEFDKAGVSPKRIMREFCPEQAYEPGQEIKVSDMFEVGDSVDVSGVSKGKGYQGAIKRHGQSRGPMAHGSKYHRGAGSMGSTSTPGKVLKGKKLPGHMGSERVTVQNLKVVQVDGERNILVIRGAVPGPKGGLLEVKTSTKTRG